MRPSEQIKKLENEIGRLRAGIQKINDCVIEIYHQHNQDDATLDKADNISKMCHELLTPKQESNDSHKNSS